MKVAKFLLNLISRYFSFVFGFIFVFIIGATYAFVQPEGILINAIFLVISLGWVVYIIKSLWDIIDKKREEDFEEVDIKIESPQEKI